jgi:ABC-type Mn2+/Zn2+ transport system permease subunit
MFNSPLTTKRQQRLSLIAATIVASFGGLPFAYFFGFSIGPAIALFLCVALVITSLLAKL